MFSSETKIRVRYAETDKMGYVYYGNYAIYFEVARVETLRQLGISYKKLEDEGIMLPVIDYSVKFLKPVFYDEEIIIKTSVKEIPKVRIKFFYEVINFKNEIVCKAETTLVFIDKNNNRPCAAPKEIIEALNKFINTIS